VVFLVLLGSFRLFTGVQIRAKSCETGHFEDKYDEEYQIIYTQIKSKGDEEFLLMLHKGLFAEGIGR
jgi:hypothetical protein